MKNKFWIIVFIALVIAIIAFKGCREGVVSNHFRSFSLGEYTSFISGEFSAENLFGEKVILYNIETAEEAALAIEPYLFEIYGEDQIIQQRSYIVSYDKKTNIWLIQGNHAYLGKGVGGVVNAIISKETGDILAIWHGE